jgi:carbon storage regulator
MLIIARRTNQKIVISDDIEITILEIGRNRVRFGVEAPKEVSIQTKLQSLPEPESISPAADDKTPPLRAMAAGQSRSKP